MPHGRHVGDANLGVSAVAAEESALRALARAPSPRPAAVTVLGLRRRERSARERGSRRGVPPPFSLTEAEARPPRRNRSSAEAVSRLASARARSHATRIEPCGRIVATRSSTAASDRTKRTADASRPCLTDATSATRTAASRPRQQKSPRYARSRVAQRRTVRVVVLGPRRRERSARERRSRRDVPHPSLGSNPNQEARTETDRHPRPSRVPLPGELVGPRRRERPARERRSRRGVPHPSLGSKPNQEARAETDRHPRPSRVPLSLESRTRVRTRTSRVHRRDADVDGGVGAEQANRRREQAVPHGRDVGDANRGVAAEAAEEPTLRALARSPTANRARRRARTSSSREVSARATVA